MKKFKRITAAVLAAAMVIGSMPQVTAAEQLGLSLTGSAALAEGDSESDKGVSIVPKDFTPVTFNVAEFGRDDIDIINPWSDNAVLSEVEIPEKTKDISVCFDVDNCDTVFTAWCQFSANEWNTPAYEKSDYDQIGRLPKFVINHSGSYEIIVPLGLFMEIPSEYTEKTFEYLQSIDFMRLFIEGDTEYSCAAITVTDIKAYEKRKYSIPFKIIGKEAAIDHDNGIIIENPNLEGKNLEVEQSASSTQNEIIYNITLKDENGNEVQPEGEVTVKIPLPEGWDGEKTKVTHRDKDGKLTDMKAEYKNGYMVFVTNHFSEYILAQKPDVQKGELNGDGKVTTVDAKWVLQAVSGSRELTDEQKAAADVNGDGKITTVDAKWILQAVSGSRELE